MRNFLIPIQRYKRLLSCTHSLYRILNSTFSLKDLLIRLARFICQTFKTEDCSITLLDVNKQYAILRCVVSQAKRYVTEEKTKITNRIEKRVIRTSSIFSQKNILAVPIIIGTQIVDKRHTE